MSSSTTSPTTTTSTGKVSLQGSYDTLFITLHARALDAESPNPVLNDQFAARTVRRIRNEAGYDFSRLEGGFHPRSVAMRARSMDLYTGYFLGRRNSPATVLQVACGMDARSCRVKWQGEGRIWIDADSEDVVQLRRQFMEQPDTKRKGGEYRLMDLDIADEDWMEKCGIPADRPLFIIFPSLTMYLTTDQLDALLRRVVTYNTAHHLHGELLFDAVGPVTYFVVRNFYKKRLEPLGTRFHCYLTDAKSLEEKHPGLKYKGTAVQMKDYERFGVQHTRLTKSVLSMVDSLNMVKLLGGAYVFEF